MKCPGQDPRFWKFDAIFDARCPKCNAVVEFFKDETRRRCKKCGHQVLNPNMDFGCAAHCKFAEQCFGELPPELIKKKQDLFKDRIAVEMKVHLKNDFKRIAHGAKVARHVETIVTAEQGDPAIALSAAYLNEVKDAHRADDNGKPPLHYVREILDKLDAPEPVSEQVCDILEGKHTDTVNYKAFADALTIADAEQGLKKGEITKESVASIIERDLLTQSGKEVAVSALQGEA